MDIYFVEEEKIYKGHHLVCVFVHDHRCGYIGLPQGHLLENKDYDEIDLEIHGGLTFASNGFHFKKDGYNYYIGFDCAHIYDGYDIETILKHNPNVDIAFYELMNQYDVTTIKTTKFVINELENAVKQLLGEAAQ